MKITIANLRLRESTQQQKVNWLWCGLVCQYRCSDDPHDMQSLQLDVSLQMAFFLNVACQLCAIK